MSSNARAARRRAERAGKTPLDRQTVRRIVWLSATGVLVCVLVVAAVIVVRRRSAQAAAETYCAVYDATHDDIKAASAPPVTSASTTTTVLPPTTTTTSAAVSTTTGASTTTIAPAGAKFADPTIPSPPPPGPVPSDSTPPGSTPPGSTPSGSTPAGSAPGATPPADAATRAEEARKKRRDASPDSLRASWDIILDTTAKPSRTQQLAHADAVKAVNEFAKNECGRDGDM